MRDEVLDPVCGMMVNPDSAAGEADYRGETYYFCSRGCKVAFEKEPEKYLHKQHHDSGMHHHH
jgi:YHS domain-containing protein